MGEERKQYIPGVCPVCGEEGNIDYGGVEIEGDLCFFPGVCLSCGSSFKEYYTLNFDTYTDIERKE